MDLFYAYDYEMPGRAGHDAEVVARVLTLSWHKYTLMVVDVISAAKGRETKSHNLSIEI